MKILHVIGGLGKAAGTSVFCAEVARELADRGDDVTIATCEPTGQNAYPLDPRVHLVSVEDVLRSSSSESALYDIVHIHALWSLPLHRVACWARTNHIPVVWSPHGMLTPWALKNHWPKKLAGLLAYQYQDLRKATLLHATADSEVEDIRRLHLKNPVVVAPLGVRLGEVKARKQGGEKYIAFVSRIQRKKGLPNLIQAWARLPVELRQGWTIKIAGPDQDDHTAELKELCEQLGVTASVQFLGPVYDAAKDELYANAAFSVLPTHSENFGSVVIESLAQRTPVICTKGAPWHDLVEYGCGWWIDIGVDPLVKALTEAMELAEHNPAALEGMGQKGLALVDHKFTWKAVADTLKSAYAR